MPKAYMLTWPVKFKICLKTGCPINFISVFLYMLVFVLWEIQTKRLYLSESLNSVDLRNPWKGGTISQSQAYLHETW